MLGGHVMHAEDAWPFIRVGPFLPGRGRPNQRDLEAVRLFAGSILRNYEGFSTGELPQSISVPRGAWSWHILSLPVTRTVLRWGMLGKYVRKKRCDKCGKCVDICPTSSIRLEEYPRFANTCMGCFACINLCPRSAIACPMSWGRRLYKGPEVARGAET